MTTEFITNKEKKLAEVINNILPSCENLYFLVGYFYFSGFEQIHEQIRDKKLKILVGLEIERDLANRIREYEILESINRSRSKLRDDYCTSLVGIFNETDFFDSQEKQHAFRVFLEKVHDGTLEIRKTLHSNHAKLYIFENAEQHSQGGEFLGTVITGSSNLTRSGLKDRFEINVVSRNNHDFKEASQIFTQLWDESVVIVDENNKDAFLNKVIENIWLDKLPKPFLLYVRVLAEYFAEYTDDVRLPGDITDGKYFNLRYQIDAIRRAINVIKRHNGVIVADVVGLGKSIIASVVAHHFNLKTIVITPPHLVEQWNDYRFDFYFNAKVYSSGRIKAALDENQDDEEKLIIIDEAHKYRNELTADYANLHKLCQQNKVIQLSATPFNNRPQDIFAMIKLFQIPTRSTIQAVENLSYQFQMLVAKYKEIHKLRRTRTATKPVIAEKIKRVADEIRAILSPLVVRRSRLDLETIEEYKKDLEQQNISFPEVQDPEELNYRLGELSELYINTLRIIAPEDESKGLVGARYMPTSYIKDFEKYRRRIAEEMGIDENLLKQSQINLAKFMKRLLVRRFESSMQAFKLTLDYMIDSSKIMLYWHDKLGKVPIYKKGNIPDPNEFFDLSGDDAIGSVEDIVDNEQLRKYVDRGMWFIESKELLKGFADQVRKDLAMLENIRDNWFADGFPDDPKLIHFVETIQKQIKSDPARKIVVFSEFADTANYLYDNLKNRLRVFKYSSDDNTKGNRQVIRDNFDAGYSSPKNDYDILIATDAISEGFNLHRAGTVFNYDIPYNPTRVIQRVGRINRINIKVFDKLYIYNFFPTATGEQETHIKQIATLKMEMIHALLGEDTKILTEDEELRSYFSEQFRNLYNSQEQLSPETRHENVIRNLRHYQADVVEQALDLPKRIKIRRSTAKDRTGALVFAKKGNDYAFKLGMNNTDPVLLTPSEGLELFEAHLTEDPQKTTDGFESIYQQLKSDLFTKQTAVAQDRGKQDAINKLRVLKDKLLHKRDYIEDLLYVAEKLDALPDRFMKMIRAIKLKTIEKDFDDLMVEVPTNYLSKIIDREQKISSEKEILILAEELI
jgi:superfamily II DNA or RNA helicase/HKD family nuclease